jgi:hypothetical protein
VCIKCTNVNETAIRIALRCGRCAKSFISPGVYSPLPPTPVGEILVPGQTDGTSARLCLKLQIYHYCELFCAINCQWCWNQNGVPIPVCVVVGPPNLIQRGAAGALNSGVAQQGRAAGRPPKGSRRPACGSVHCWSGAAVGQTLTQLNPIDGRAGCCRTNSSHIYIVFCRHFVRWSNHGCSHRECPNFDPTVVQVE